MDSEKLKIIFFLWIFFVRLFDSEGDTEFHDIKILTRFPENPILEILIKVAQICAGCFGSKFPANWSEFTIFSIVFESSTNLDFDNKKSSIGVENPKILGIQPIADIYLGQITTKYNGRPHQKGK